MASKKKGALTRQCRIFQWVEEKDPELAGAIRDLCLEGALAPGRGGVTFLYPKDKAYRDEIAAKAYSDEADEAVRLIQALILPEAYLTGADFNRGAVGSRLGVKYAVESADAKSVRIAGMRLEPAGGFRPLASREGNLAVWVIAEGRPPLTGEEYRPARPRKESARGGAEGSGQRAALAAHVEQEFAACMQRDGARSHDPYLARVVGLLHYLEHQHPEALERVAPALDYDPVVTFYLLLEPYKTKGECLLPDALLFGEGGWGGAAVYGNAVAEYEGAFHRLFAQTDGTKAFALRDHAGVAAQVDVVRLRILRSPNPRDAPRAVKDAYGVLAAQNQIGGMGPIFPAAATAALAPHCKKLWQDEFRFVNHVALQSLRAEFDMSEFAHFVQGLRDSWRGDDYESELRLASAANLQSGTNVAPRAELLLLLRFVNSTDFLYTPAAPEHVGPAMGNPHDPTDESLYNRNASALQALHRITGMVHAGLSPQTQQEVRLYLAQHNGMLPPDIAALVTQH